MALFHIVRHERGTAKARCLDLFIECLMAARGERQRPGNEVH